ncbi:MAG: bifunctional ADP-dependent NAD(P)H-hydrate dehydratase/NAD(P)H-hydrate epimerase, partial [SAR202 cluster bacterium]|nr:bifunctional ADP-dependent NAD(P)H-hydrate dehydratase/NAD(P)H-hydrate epimerase [SAR202 cluster bacterium]
MKLVTVQEMLEVEEAAVKRGVALDTLMENAGLAVARVAMDLLANTIRPQVVVLVGPGNNGSDGLVAARHLQTRGASVTAYLTTPRTPADPKLARAAAEGVGVAHANEDPDLTLLQRLLGDSTLVVDAVFG